MCLAAKHGFVVISLSVFLVVAGFCVRPCCPAVAYRGRCSAQRFGRIGRIRALLAGLASAVPGFDKDRDVARDVAMLDEYLALLAAGAGGQPEPREHLAESLRYAGRLKVLPRPVGAGGGR